MDEIEKRIASEKELESILDILMSHKSKEGEYDFRVTSIWQGSTQWSRNRIGIASNRKQYGVVVFRDIDGGEGMVMTNQVDEKALSSAVKYAEWKALLESKNQLPHGYPMEVERLKDVPANVWSDNTASYNFLESGKAVQHACSKAQEHGLMSAGYIDCTIGSSAFMTNKNTTLTHDSGFGRLTRGECSITARNSKGFGSGWAGRSDVDFDKINEAYITDIALKKCLASMNPVRVEPGRYTVILEPQAVADMITELLFSNALIMNRVEAEDRRSHPFHLERDYASGLGLSKLGVKLFDERISVWHDPADSDLGVLGLFPKDRGVKKVSWVDKGVLVSLEHSSAYSVTYLDKSEHNNHRKSFRMDGGDTTLEDMIAATERGILVTRFSPPAVTHFGSMMSTGLTRDGLWLIENGKVSNSLRNFRTLESPFFILNNVEQIGKPVKVFTDNSERVAYPPQMALWRGLMNFAPQYIVPPLKIKDFSFSTTIDAV